MRDLPDITVLIELAIGEAAGRDGVRCRAIAERERQQGEAPYAALAMELAGLLGEPAGPGLLARLAADIRLGRFDAPNPKLESFLWRYVRQRLGENDPDFSL